MGGINTQEEIVARLDELDKEEININKQLRELQIELNGIVPVRDRVKVKSEYFDNVSLGKHKEDQDIYDQEESSVDGPKSKKKKLGTDGNIKKKPKKMKKKK